jgi:hypothetical protein
MRFPARCRAGAGGSGQLAPKCAAADSGHADCPCLARAGGIAAQKRKQGEITDVQIANFLMKLIVLDAGLEPHLPEVLNFHASAHA